MSASSSKVLVLGSQQTQQITRSSFHISLQPDWLIKKLNSGFFSKSTIARTQTGYTAGSPEQGFWHWLACGLNLRFNFVCDIGLGEKNREIRCLGKYSWHSSQQYFHWLRSTEFSLIIHMANFSHVCLPPVL